MIHYGDLIIQATFLTNKDFAKITKIYGNLYVYGRAELKNLTYVSKSVFVESKFTAKKLKAIDGDLHINSHLDAPKLKYVEGNVFVRNGSEILEHVTILENLKYIGKELRITDKLRAKNLQIVGKNLSVSVKCMLENLKVVGDRFFVYTDFSAPNLHYTHTEKFYKHPVFVSGHAMPIVITDNYMQIGKQKHHHDKWKSFTEAEIHQHDPNLNKWWRKTPWRRNEPSETLMWWRRYGSEMLDLCNKHRMYRETSK